MKFTRDNESSLTVHTVEPGSIRIGDETISEDVILTPSEVIQEAFPRDIAAILEEDVATALETEPEMLIIGTGWAPALPPSGLMFALARRGIGLETMDTPAACRTFNILVNEGRRPTAILKISD